eukprot:m.146270 g.146270  ORF g.146270 m.146270 type:complete len:136 (+) comp38449_c0_seq26:831-1238(+)
MTLNDCTDITPLSADVFLYWTTGNQGGLQKGGFTVVSLQQLLCRKIWIVLWPGKDEQVNLLWYTSDPDAGHLGSLVSMEPELIAINSANSALSYFSSWNLLHLDMDYSMRQRRTTSGNRCEPDQVHCTKSTFSFL